MKEYYLVDDVSYMPDCNHNMMTKNDIDKHNSTADDMVDCSWCQGTSFESYNKYIYDEKGTSIIDVKWYHIEGKPCAFCKGTGRQKRDRKKVIQSDAYYKKDDIEILRQKLIEDVFKKEKQIRKSFINSKSSGNLHPSEIERIINKRFGVEE